MHISSIHTQPARGFTIHGKDITVKNIATNTLITFSWYNIFIVVEDNKVMMWLNINPIPGQVGYTQYHFISGHSDSIDTMIKKLSENTQQTTPMGFVTTITDKVCYYKNLSVESPCLNIWFGHIEVTIKNTYQFLPTLIRHILQ